MAGNRPLSLALRNLLRGLEYGLPSGQSLARAMGLIPLNDPDILIGKDLPPEKAAEEPAKTIDSISSEFKENCPLWVYVLAEARSYSKNVPIPIIGGNRAVSTPQLGPVGGRLVTEVFLGLLFADENSYLNADPAWQPSSGSSYSLRDFVAYAIG